MASLDTLRQCEFLRPIPTPLLDRLSDIACYRDYSPGTNLFSEGMKHDHFHMIAEGTVRLEMQVIRCGRIPILTAEKGDILAWSAVVGNSMMTATAVALVPVKTLAFPGEQLRRLCEEEHEIGYHIMRQLAAAVSRRLLATRLQLLDLFADQVPAFERTSLPGKPGDEQC